MAVSVTPFAQEGETTTKEVSFRSSVPIGFILPMSAFSRSHCSPLQIYRYPFHDPFAILELSHGRSPFGRY